MCYRFLLVGAEASPLTRTSSGPGAVGAGRVPKRPDPTQGFAYGRGRGLCPAALKLPVGTRDESGNFGPSQRAQHGLHHLSMEKQ